MKKLMTYGFYVLLLAVFAVNVDFINSYNSSSSLTIEMIDEFIDRDEAIATISGGDLKTTIIFDDIGYAYIRCRFGSTGCDIMTQCPIGDPTCFEDGGWIVSK